MSFPRVGFLPLLAIIGAAIAGCGSSSSSSSAPAAPSSTTTANASAAASSGASSSATARQVTITTKHDRKLGTILAAGKNELTVYLFEADNGSGSACSGACAKLWPPVIGKGVAASKASASDLGTISRSDGTTQVTYKGHPLYYFSKDKDGEDAYGQAIKAFGADWYVLTPSGKKIDES